MDVVNAIFAWSKKLPLQ